MRFLLVLAIACGGTQPPILTSPAANGIPPYGYTNFQFEPFGRACYDIECNGRAVAFAVGPGGTTLRVELPGVICPTHETIAIVVGGDEWGTPCWLSTR